MNFSALFIHRPIGTTLLTIALAFAGLIAYQFLPVAPVESKNSNSALS